MAGHVDNNNTAGTRAAPPGWRAVLVALTVVLGAMSASAAGGLQIGCTSRKCYVHHSERVTWEQARARCREHPRGRLAVMPDLNTQAALSTVIAKSRIYGRIWVGARNTGSAWTWQNGQPLYGDEVDYYDDPSARCGYLYTGFTARIAAARCSSEKKYLCSTITGNVPSRGTREKSWYEANYNCAHHYKVLSRLSHTEMQELSDRLVPDYGHDEYWIGLCRQGWVWEDIGQDVTYTNFNGQTPYCTENKCMSIDNRARWFNDGCNSGRGFLCEIPNIGPPPQPRPTTPVPTPVRTPVPTPGPTPYVPPVPTPVPTKYVPPVPTPYVPTPHPVLTPHPLDGQKATPHAVDGHDDDDDNHSHVVLIGVIVGLAVVISALIVLLVLLILRKRRGKQAEEQDNLDNIYSEIREPPASLPQPPNPAMANLYLDNPSPCPSPRGSPVPKPRSKPMPLPKPDNLKPGCEMSTFKNHNPKRHSMAPPTMPPPDQPPPDQPRANGATGCDPTGPYAVSYIACTPKLQDKSATLDSLAALPPAPKPPHLPANGKLCSGEDEEVSRYVLPKDDVTRRLLDHRDPARRGKGNKGKGRESASLMLEENDLYSDANLN